MAYVGPAGPTPTYDPRRDTAGRQSPQAGPTYRPGTSPPGGTPGVVGGRTSDQAGWDNGWQEPQAMPHAPYTQGSQGFDWSSLLNGFPPPAAAPDQPPPAAAPGQPPPGPDMSWLDMTGKGYGEQRYEGTDWDAENPMAGYWQGIQGQFASGPSKTDFLGDYSGAFNPMEHTYSEKMAGRGAGLDPYYDRAGQEGSEKLANRFAAMGLTGASGSADAQSDLFSDLYADKAYREADFDLRSAGQADSMRFGRSGEARAWGSARDEGNRANEQQELDYILGGGRLAGDAADQGRADRESGMRAATTAQELAEGRKGDAIDRTFRQGEADRRFVSGATDELYDADTANLDRELEALLGPAAANYDMSRQQKSDVLEMVSTGVDIAEALRKAGVK